MNSICLTRFLDSFHIFPSLLVFKTRSLPPIVLNDLLVLEMWRITFRIAENAQSQQELGKSSTRKTYIWRHNLYLVFRLRLAKKLQMQFIFIQMAVWLQVYTNLPYPLKTVEIGMELCMDQGIME